MNKLIIAVFAGLLAGASLSPALAANTVSPPPAVSAPAPAPAQTVVVIHANEADVLPKIVSLTKGDTIVLVRSRWFFHRGLEVQARSRVGQTTFILSKVPNNDKLTAISPKDQPAFSFVANQPGQAKLVVHRQQADGWHIERIDVTVR
jgi:hypothetical protein